MAEIGGLLISIRQTALHGDAAGETHSAWTLELVGVSGGSCTVSWRALRKWNGSRVVYEYHYDHQQSGGPLTFDDLSAATPALWVFEWPRNAAISLTEMTALHINRAVPEWFKNVVTSLRHGTHALRHACADRLMYAGTQVVHHHEGGEECGAL